MTILVKLGGSAITEKSERFSVREDVLEGIAGVLAKLDERVLLVHGGGSFGHPVASKYFGKNVEKFSFEGFFEVNKSMRRLNSKVLEILKREGLSVFPFQTSSIFYMKNSKLVLSNQEIVENFLDRGVIPVFSGDVGLTDDGGMVIISGDQIIKHLSNIFDIRFIVMGTDVDGLFTKNPSKFSEADLIPEINPESWENISSYVDFTSEEDMTGGMMEKIDILVELARNGVESHVINIREPENLLKVVKSDKKVGTKISQG